MAILENCVAKHGGVDALARHLGVPRDIVLDWIGGTTIPPAGIIQKAAKPFLKADR